MVQSHLSFCTHLPPFKHFSVQIPKIIKSLLQKLNMFGAQKHLLTLCSRAISNTSRPSKLVDKFVRVDHAGELGADRIYAGQMAVLGT